MKVEAGEEVSLCFSDIPLQASSCRSWSGVQHFQKMRQPLTSRCQYSHYATSNIPQLASWRSYRELGLPTNPSDTRTPHPEIQPTN